ncbi:Chromatin modification-related protein eaf3 [Fusarium oxysporum f. sp. cubense race 1]|uniref:Chromatin modification-related protein EAF3 n=1 Tax=Fusarium oxysporum f. sp. cubense (strain race 1) TaxID=1229664 RepID=N4UBC0_FUSC1|nr:Chromatin modification-related protein eaf3 [Fusarium oxysporum f. sp. cubense race 1]
MAPARQQPAPPPFSKDEKVLCFHMDMLYEAKIMDVQPGEKPSDGYKYKVHYKGWKNTWDDWVLVDRIRPFDDEHKELAAQLHAQLKHNIQRSTKQPKKGLRSGAESARVSEERSGSATVQGGRGGRRGKDWELEQFACFFPISNVRGSPDLAQPGKSMDSFKSSEKVKLTDLKEPKDHLTLLPSSGHRYVTESGKLIHDDRYVMPLTVEDEPKQPCQKPLKPSAKPKPRSCDQLETEDAFHNKPMIKLPVPDHIQAMLVDDWENITKNNQLVPLPHNKPVTKIFEDYLAHERPHREEGSSSMDILEEVVAGFREYFEKALSRILLYRFERHQYMDLKKLWENTEANPEITNVCDVYGAEHLARLIVSLPELLAQTNMDQQSVSRLREEIGKFNVWLGRNCETYFVNEYETPSQEYIDKARSF